MRIFRTIGCTLLLLAPGLAYGQSATPNKIDPILDRITAEFIAAFNAQDAEKIGSFYAEDAVWMSPRQPIMRGRRNIEAQYREAFAQGLTDLQITPIESAAADSQAFEAGTSSVALHGVLATGKYVVIYKRVDGEWKIAYDIFTSD